MLLNIPRQLFGRSSYIGDVWDDYVPILGRFQVVHVVDDFG